jgi:hypothetical protein
MDRDRNKTTTKNPAGKEGTPSTPLRSLLSRSELNAIITNQGGPVTNCPDARKWLENKGWTLEGEQFDRSKIVNILLTVSLLPKVPPEVVHAIKAAAFVLDDDISDNISTTLANEVSDKINAGLSAITNKLERSLAFLEANSNQ